MPVTRSHISEIISFNPPEVSESRCYHPPVLKRRKPRFREVWSLAQSYRAGRELPRLESQVPDSRVCMLLHSILVVPQVRSGYSEQKEDSTQLFFTISAHRHTQPELEAA